MVGDNRTTSESQASVDARLLKTSEFCALVGCVPATARTWHRQGKGPRRVTSPGGQGRYRYGDVRAWLAAREA